MAETRKMIRFDDADDEPVPTHLAGRQTEDEAVSHEQQVRPHSCEEYLVTDHCGVSYQKCGGGRRRLPKRS